MSPADRITNSVVERFCNRHPRAAVALILAGLIGLLIIGGLLDAGTVT